MTLQKTAYLAIDAGGTYLKSAVLDRSGNVMDDSSFMVPSFSDGAREEIVQAIQKTVTHGLQVIRKNNLEPGGIGIAFPGPFDYYNATSWMEHKFRNIYGVNLRETIYSFRGVSRDIPIVFIHDSTAVLAGEIWKGNAQGFDNVVVVTLGTGLGFTFTENGIIQLNSLGGPLISVFRLPYKSGILEDYVSKRGFLRLYQEISGNYNVQGIKVSDIGKWADQGDETSIRTFYEAGRIFSESLKNIFIERNIQCILFGGQISWSFHHLEGALKEGLCEVSSLKKISTVKSIENSALWGIIHTLEKTGLN